MVNCLTHVIRHLKTLNITTVNTTPGFCSGHFQELIITRWRSWSFAEYCKHYVARLNDLHAFGYNSAGSERIWMKFGELQVYCLNCIFCIVYCLLYIVLQIFGAIRAEARAGILAEVLFFCQVNNARLCRFPVSQISQNLHIRRGSARWWILTERNFQNLPARGRFFPKTHVFDNVANDFPLQTAITPWRYRSMKTYG